MDCPPGQKKSGRWREVAIAGGLTVVMNLFIYFLYLLIYLFSCCSHIKEHLKDEIDLKDEQMSDEDLQFHYFKLHDYDHNNKLDGIELMNAMTHYHDEDGDGKNPHYTDDEMGHMIDQILDEDDLNKDGYIDYPEFVASQKS